MSDPRIERPSLAERIGEIRRERAMSRSCKFWMLASAFTTAVVSRDRPERDFAGGYTRRTLELRLGPLSADIEYATVAEWRKGEGDAVTAGETILEIETDKVTQEIEAPAGGTLSEIIAVEGDEIKVGSLLAIIDEDAA
jgi:acetyl/propionyl-CoA carboxylase alpha subunit